MLILLFSLTLFVIMVIMGALVVLIWHYIPPSLDPRSRIILSAIVLGCATVTTSYGLELLVSDLSIKLILVFLRYAGSALELIATVFFSLWYLGRLDRVSRTAAAAICIPAVLVLIVIATDSLHHLFYPQIWLISVDGILQLQHSVGPVYIVAHLVALLYIGAGIILLVSARYLGPRAYDRAGTLVLLGVLFPVPGYFLYLAGVRPFGFLNLMLYCYAGTAICLTLATVRFRILDLRPIAHSALIRNLPAGMVVIDDQLRVLEVNPAAAAMLGYPEQSLINRPVTGLFTEEDLGRNFFQTGGPSETVIHRNGRYFHLTLAPLADWKAETIGHLLLLQDITESRKSADALRQTNDKLQILSSITRHDIRNQLTALNAYIQLSEDAIDNPTELRIFFAKEQRITETIASQISFTRDYENMGVKSPVWQDVGVLVRNAGAALPMRNVGLEIRCSGLEVFADPLLEKVFYNLIDNALRYGGDSMTAIRVIADKSGEDLDLIVEDDGTGISVEDKKHIFTKGFGKHTGLGLFLSREILSITGLSITEEGMPGTGARFVIRVPVGKFRGIYEGS